MGEIVCDKQKKKNVRTDFRRDNDHVCNTESGSRWRHHRGSTHLLCRPSYVSDWYCRGTLGLVAPFILLVFKSLPQQQPYSSQVF